MISIRRARPQDAAAIGGVHVVAWRDSYAGLLPDRYLSEMSPARVAAGYQRGMMARRGGEAVFVAEASDGSSGVIGFASAARARREGMGEGEIETLYVLPDWRDEGTGRRLLRASAAHLAAIGCRSAMLWVLSGNHSRFFYRRLGGRPVASEVIRVGGREVEQMAIAWNPISTLLAATAVQRES